MEAPPRQQNKQSQAPADIFLSANVPWVDHLVNKGIIEAKNTKNILKNRLVLITNDQTRPKIDDLKSTDFSKLLQDEKIAMGMVMVSNSNSNINNTNNNSNSKQ